MTGSATLQRRAVNLRRGNILEAVNLNGIGIPGNLTGFEVCFSYQSRDLRLLPPPEHVCLLLEFRFRIEFFDFQVSAYRYRS
jgi:hypothetical protein